ncbi:MAG: Mur ligase family protein [Patescibacteria group bacterium]
MKHIHFIGICGVAMSALAIAFSEDGWKVTGSDVGFYPPISDHLKKHRINFYPGWHPEKMMRDDRPDIVVVGNVAGSTNPEFFAARENELNIKSYPEVVAEYIVQDHSVVCAGTYGKTSSSALLTWILSNAQIQPSYMFGGISLNMPLSAKLRKDKNRSGWSVLEGDEYKTARWDNRPKFMLYSPTHLLLSAALWDHADVFPTAKDYLKAFKDLIKLIPRKGLIVACIDGENIKELIADVKAITYGKSNADYVYKNISQTKDGIKFAIENRGETYQVFAPVLGEHMAENICGCFAVAYESGIDADTILNSIATFKGIRRRLEKKAEGDITIYDDLAHSPTKARATLKTLRTIYPESKIIAIFEPNTGHRRPQSAPGYDNAFTPADEVIIPTLTKLKVDSSETELPFEGEELAQIISKTHRQTIHIPDDTELIDYILKNTKKEDVVVFLGSHGFRGMIDKLVTCPHPQLQL